MQRRPFLGVGCSIFDCCIPHACFFVGWEEYYDYFFPGDDDKPNLKFVELAHKWKMGMFGNAGGDDDGDEEEDDDDDE